MKNTRTLEEGREEGGGKGIRIGGELFWLFPFVGFYRERKRSGKVDVKATTRSKSAAENNNKIT